MSASSERASNTGTALPKLSVIGSRLSAVETASLPLSTRPLHTGLPVQGIRRSAVCLSQGYGARTGGCALWADCTNWKTRKRKSSPNKARNVSMSMSMSRDDLLPIFCVSAGRSGTVCLPSKYWVNRHGSSFYSKPCWNTRYHRKKKLRSSRPSRCSRSLPEHNLMIISRWRF